MSGSYEATFRWPHPGASDVIVTGTFDGWTCSHHLTRRPSGTFEGTVQIPWGETVQYKYIVDGRWTTTDDQPTELDPIGNLNNVLRAPARPPTPVATHALHTVKEDKPEEEEEEEEKKKKKKDDTQEPAQRGVLGTVVDTVNGHVDFVKQAAVSMVEAIAPGTTETPAATPVAETQQSKPKPAPQEQPVPAPELSESEPPAASTDLTSAVLPTSPAPESTLPEVPVPVLPLSTEPPVETATLPSADVSESKPLETTIVEGSATQETAVDPAFAPAPAPEPEPVKEVEIVPVTADGEHAAANEDVKESPVEAQDVAANKPLETTVVEGSATAETAIAPVETAPAEDAEKKPSTHAPAEASEKVDEKPAANGTEPAPAPPVNGTNGAHAPEPAANGKTPSSYAKAPTPPGSNGTSPSSTPAKEKRMRFPSLSSRSLHARSRSSAESALAPSELGEGGSKTASANGSVASRKGAAAGAGATERAKRRTSMFGKLKDIFHHKHEASA